MEIIEKTRKDLKVLVAMAEELTQKIIGHEKMRENPSMFNEILKAAIAIYITQGQLHIPDFSQM